MGRGLGRRGGQRGRAALQRRLPAELRKADERPARPQTGLRKVQPPSWRRVAKRGLIFAPLMFLTVSFLSSELSLVQKIGNTVFLLAFFLPFSYAMDVLMYRMFLKRGGAPAGQG